MLVGDLVSGIGLNLIRSEMVSGLTYPLSIGDRVRTISPCKVETGLLARGVGAAVLMALTALTALFRMVDAGLRDRSGLMPLAGTRMDGTI